MKLHSLNCKIILFFLPVLFLIIPPFFGESSGVDFTVWNFPVEQLFLFLFSMILFLFTKELHQSSKSIFFTKLIFLILTFLGLMISSYMFTPMIKYSENFIPVAVKKPDNFVHWIFCFCDFFFSAFFEEVIYRYFIPEGLRFLLKEGTLKNILIEIFSLLLFAFGHLYLGWFAVLNAGTGYIILRFCYKKTKSLFPGIAAHFSYNLIQLLISPF